MKFPDMTNNNSIDDRADLLSREEIYETLNELMYMSDKYEIANESLYKLEMSLENDINANSTDSVDSVYITRSIEEFNVELEIINAPKSNKLSIESIYDSTLSLEALIGEKKSLISNITQYVKNLYHDFMDTYNTFKATVKLATKYNINDLVRYESELKSGKRKVTEVYRYSASSINKKLAIFYVMGYSLTANNLIEFLSLPYELITKDNLFKVATTTVYDTLKALPGEKQYGVIPLHQQSLKILEDIDMDNVQDLLNKDTKFGIMDRFLGDRFSILSVYQDNETTDTRWDYFKIDKDRYDLKNKTLTEDEVFKLIEFGKELVPMGNSISKEAEDLFKENIIQDLKNNIVTQVLEVFINKDNASGNKVKSLYRRRFVAGKFTNGVYKCLLMLYKSHLDSVDLVTQLVRGTTKRK